MRLSDYTALIRQAASMDVLQVAIGGGNPTQHPDFAEILRTTRSMGIVPSYTTNGRGLTPEVLEATKRFCGAVAVSAYEPWEEFEAALQLLKANGIAANVHFVLSNDSFAMAEAWLRDPPSFLHGINALVFLNFKPVTRVNDQTGLTRAVGAERLKSFYASATSPGLPFRIGFDSCMVAGLAWHTAISPTTFEACEAGRFSMFVSEEMKAYPCSFMVGSWHGVPVTDTNLQSIWQTHTAFAGVREKLTKGRCNGCANAHSCMGGCPIFPDINLCDPFVKGLREPDTYPFDVPKGIRISAPRRPPVASE